MKTLQQPSKNFDTNFLKSAIVLLVFILMNIFSSNAQCVSATDCDGDGIENAIDLDDDNDGILDCVENGLNNNSLSDLFTIAGDATFVNSNEIELTPDVNNQAGSSMSFGKVDFTSDFNFSIEINLGTKDIGADGSHRGVSRSS